MSQTPESFDPLLDKPPARYVVGIDLGTTNSALTYVDTEERPWKVRLLKLPQLTAPNSVEARDTLPSFHFQTMQQQAEGDALKLPWHKQHQDWCVGFMARDEGVKSPGRLSASAKSWLCHSGVNREAKLLPWQPAEGVDRLSPLEVSARLLGHMCDAWNHKFKNDLLEEQDVVITLPASFDEVARELTVRAAAAAGLSNIVLIEEPQAAFYAWVYKHDQDWFDRVEAGHNILVCDIGGGTSDFTLIKVRQSATQEDESEEREGTEAGRENPSESKSPSRQKVQFHRVAVGDHLILGGDNLDLALAHHIEQQMGQKLNPKQWDVLVRSCRRVKETLLGEDAPEKMTVNLPGSGSKLIGGGLQAEIQRAEAEKLLIDGFLPGSKVDDRPNRGQSGFREFGLPFASDPAITKHLAEFLRSHADKVTEEGEQEALAARPDVILFNGGFFASKLLRDRLIEVIKTWFASDADYEPLVLDNDRLDLAVARGAAYYGMVRRGEGVKIAASLARSYYVEVDSSDGQPQAICLVPGSTEPGQDIHLKDLKLDLTVAEPVEFSLHVSSTRLADKAGEILAVDPEQMKALPPIRTVLRTERRNQKGTIPVTLHAHLSEIGTIDLGCQAVDTEHRWRLQFDVRSATETDRQAHVSAAEDEGVVDEGTWQACEAVIEGVFAEGGEEKPAKILRRLSETLGSGKFDWPTSLLRRIWEKLLSMQEGRKRSPAHEARWLNLLGFALRPGYGLAVDDWRVAETWRHVNKKLAHAGASKNEALILWRRIAGGLTGGQQSALADPMISSLRAAHSILIHNRQARGEPMYPMHESEEAWRLLGSLENLEADVKLQVGKMLVDLFPKRRYEKMRGAMLWSLGRLGGRQPLYGPLNNLVSSDTAYRWCKSIMEFHQQDATHRNVVHLALMQLARKTEDRHRDLSDSARQEVISFLNETETRPRYIELVESGGELQAEETASVFGEALPKGFRIQS